MGINEDIFDEQEEEGVQPYQKDSIPPDRELVTTPYDPPVKSIVQEINNKELIVNPSFQRKSVWDNTRKSRLIESLLLNIPIPVCFFAEDKDGKKVVVDGQQRLRAIEEYKSGGFTLSGLQVLDQLNGKKWVDLTPRQARIIDNRTIRCIVISEKSDPNIRFEVFERLNTGGVPLNDQELRNCVFRGAFNELLDELSRDKTWLRLVGKNKPDERLRHHELILRFFAVRQGLNDYKPPLKKFLNDFMRDNREADKAKIMELKSAFQTTIASVDAAFGERAFRKVKIAKDGSGQWDSAINRAVFDIQMVGLGPLPPNELSKLSNDIVYAFEKLCREDSEFSESITRSTADRVKFFRRFRTMRGALRKLGLDPSQLNSLPEDTLTA
jgi:uncharacterized protein with ParB-like and HNH nuclease domain